MTVSDNLSVLRLEGNECLLWRAGNPDPMRQSGDDPIPANAVFAVPGDAVRLVEFAVTPDEAKHLARSLPFMLEDEVVEDIDDLHFARLSLDEGRWLAAIVRREVMDAWLANVGEDFEGQWLPEFLLLPWQAGELCLLIERDGVLLRYGEWQGTRIEASLLPAVLATLPAEPTSVVVYGDNQQADLALLPEPLQGKCQWRQGSFGKALMLSSPQPPALNLRQGVYAVRLPLGRWWQTWKRVAMVAGATLILGLGADVAEYQRLKTENLALREAIQSSYRQANPRGAVVDAEKQLDRQLAEFNPASTGVALTPLLAAITAEVAKDEGLSISTLNFSASSGEIRLDLVAGDYAAVESLRRRLAGAGLEATLETSSSRNDQVRARLRVEGRA